MVHVTPVGKKLDPKLEELLSNSEAALEKGNIADAYEGICKALQYTLIFDLNVSEDRINDIHAKALERGKKKLDQVVGRIATTGLVSGLDEFLATFYREILGSPTLQREDYIGHLKNLFTEERKRFTAHQRKTFLYKAIMNDTDARPFVNTAALQKQIEEQDATVQHERESVLQEIAAQGCVKTLKLLTKDLASNEKLSEEIIKQLYRNGKYLSLGQAYVLSQFDALPGDVAIMTICDLVKAAREYGEKCGESPSQDLIDYFIARPLRCATEQGAKLVIVDAQQGHILYFLRSYHEYLRQLNFLQQISPGYKPPLPDVQLVSLDNLDHPKKENKKNTLYNKLSQRKLRYCSDPSQDLEFIVYTRGIGFFLHRARDAQYFERHPTENSRNIEAARRCAEIINIEIPTKTIDAISQCRQDLSHNVLERMRRSWEGPKRKVYSPPF